ncbi:MAG: DNA-binding protein [Actinobacteria bacterium]|nr:DNA-binding protein [Actinomycetota bacterium]NBY14958.1 DNA-binding protein [Actinomycetota bacterium]
MAMNLRLSDEQSDALRKLASQEGISMQEAALTAIDEYISRRDLRMKSAIERVLSEDKDLLDRLGQ